jgi:outer membrane receptor for ferrienterochelin and colicins
MRVVLGCLLLAAFHNMAVAQPDSLMDLEMLSLDSLLNLKISSVSKYAQTTAEAPASVTIISKEDILSYGYNDIGELVNSLRDIYVSDDRNYGYLGIRGFSRPTDYNNRVAIMVDGVVLNENIWGGSPIGSEFHGLNIDNVDHVEVIRGPASAMYGNYPMLGMINVVTHSGKSLDGGKASVEQGSYGKWQGSLAVGKVLKNGLDLNVGARAGQIAGQQLYYAEYDDSSTNNGIADKRDGSRFWGVNAKLTFHDFTLKGLLTWRDIDVPTGAYGTTFNDKGSHVIDRYGYVDLSYAHDLNTKVALFGRAWLNTYHNGGYYPYDDAGGGLQRELTEGLWGGAEARLRYDIAANNRLLVGAEFQQHFKAEYYLDYPDSVVFDNSFPFHTFSIYAQNEYQPSKNVTITAGGRFDRLYLGRIALTPRVAVNYFVSKSTTLKALYGEAFRAPTIYEVNVGFDGYILPNYDLRPERVRSFELVLEQRFAKGYQATVSLYHNRLRNLIDQETNSDSTLQFQNVGSAGGLGASAELQARLQHGLNFYANYSYTQMRNLQDDAWLTNSPYHMAKGGLSIPLLRHFRLSPEVIAQSARLTVYDTQTKPFLYASANLLFAPKFKGAASFLNHFQWSFKVRNLFNTDYRLPGGFEHLQPAIQQNGRNYNLKLTVNLF